MTSTGNKIKVQESNSLKFSIDSLLTRKKLPPSPLPSKRVDLDDNDSPVESDDEDNSSDQLSVTSSTPGLTDSGTHPSLSSPNFPGHVGLNSSSSSSPPSAHLNKTSGLALPGHPWAHPHIHPGIPTALSHPLHPHHHAFLDWMRSAQSSPLSPSSILSKSFHSI